MKYAFLACLVILMTVAQVSAAPMTLTREYIYKAGDADSKLSSRSIALEQVKRLLLEELGTYLVSNTIVVNAQLSKDEIVTYTAGAVVTVILAEKWDGDTYYLKARLTADPDDVARTLTAIKHDRERATELEQLRRQASDSLKEIERLNKELSASKSTTASGTSRNQTGELRKQYEERTGELAAKEFLEQGLALRDANKFDQAVMAFTKAIELAPTWARPYAGRGAAYVRMNDYTRGETDLERAKTLDPTNMIAVGLHGVSLMQQGKNRDGLVEIEKAVTLDPENTVTNTTMGWALMQLNQPHKALPFLTKAITLSEGKFGRAYLLRARAFRMLGAQDKARADRKAAEALGETSLPWERAERRALPRRVRP